MVSKGLYDDAILNYTDSQLEEVSKWINVNRDLDYDYAGANILANRYLIQEDDNVLELPQEAYLTMALLLALPSRNKRMEVAKSFYDVLSLRKISLATPILLNLRRKNGSLSSCFILSASDTLESITDSWKDVAFISKNAGGVGVNYSAIRAQGSYLLGNPGLAKGVVAPIKVLNDIAVYVDQGGKRAGAVTVGIDIWHLDVPDFLEMKTENGDQRKKAYDVFPQLVISDEFMRRAKADKSWTLIDPYEVKKVLGIDLPSLWGKEFEKAYSLIESEVGKSLTLYNKVSAKDLFKKIMKSNIETGLPYWTFKDTINRYNPNRHDGYIPQTNLCVESYSNVKADKYTHVCNLVSLNLSNIFEEELESVSKLAVVLLDNTIDITTPPSQKAKDHNERYRTVGCRSYGSS